jgi:hypothetical protein
MLEITRSSRMEQILKENAPMKSLKHLKYSLLLVACVCQAQNWSGIITPSRATNWAYSGLPATLPDGETTANPWTPPVRTQCGSTVAAGTSFATIDSDLAACPAGTYLLLAAGSFSSSTTGLTMGSQNNVTLRGSGADQTKLSCTGSCSVNFQNPDIGTANTTWSGNYAQGDTTITANGLAPGELLTLVGTGVSTDPGGVWVCSDAGVCSEEGGINMEYENHWATAVSGSTVTITPPIGFPAFGSLSGQEVYVASNPSVGDGLEDLSLDFGSAGNIYLAYSYASWIKGVRIVNASSGGAISVNTIGNCLIANNYITQTTQENSESMVPNTTGFDLILNNIVQSEGIFSESGGGGDVWAFNLFRDAYNNGGGGYVNNTISNHSSGYAMNLWEGNEFGDEQDDNVHGTSNLNTFFRNIIYGNDPPYHETNNIFGLAWEGIARFENAVGNVIGGPWFSNYKCTSSSCSTISSIVTVGNGNTGITDALSNTTAMLWGNYDTVTNAVRWCGNSSSPAWSATCESTSEVPTSLSGNAAAYENPVPGSTTLPASFFMSTTAHPSGGTGLSWWNVCTNYPTCSTSSTDPFPPIGPDVTGGNITGTNGFPNYQGYAYHIPAYIAWKNLPIDTSYQGTYTISSSSWSSGTETLTVSSLPSGVLLSGEFQISAGSCAGTYMMTASTSTTISYAATSNPGSCTSGSFLFPDVRTFNEKAYQADTNPSSGSAPAAPTNLLATPSSL